MDIRELLQLVQDGEMTVDKAVEYFDKKAYEEMGFAKVDTNRELRSGFPEVVFCEGKTDEHLLAIYQKLYDENGEVFGTRANREQYELVKNVMWDVQYDDVSRILKVSAKEHKKIGKIAICTAGTSDIPVAEEAAQTAEFFGSNVDRYYDIGVSGIHRLLDHIEEIRKANCDM